MRRTTTDANGNYIFEFHPDGDGTTQEWHVSAYNHDGTAYVNSFNNPGVTAELPEFAIPDSGVSRWTYDEGSGTTASDSWGSNDGAITDATYSTDAEIGTHSLAFNGTSAFVDMGDVSAFDPGTGELSWSLWVKSGSPVGGDPGSSSGYIFDKGIFSGGYGLRSVDGTDLEFVLGDGTATVRPSTALSWDDTWTHTVATWSGETATLYVDGSQVDAVTDAGLGSVAASDPLAYGVRTNKDEYYAGLQDDPRVYDTELTGSAVSNLYNTGSING